MAHIYISMEFQWFLGFANFYHWFIRNYGAVAEHLTALISSNMKFNYKLKVC